MTLKRVPFPAVYSGGFTITRPFTAPGLFAYRHLQAEGLLRFPDFGSGEMNDEQRGDALSRMVNVHRPMAAVVLFLGVVGLEDFIRDMGARLADTAGLEQYFPDIATLRPIAKKNRRPYARPDKDPAPISDWPEVNALYERAIGVQPFPVEDLPRLHDLALIRHTVAHHAALVRPIDVPRFQYWDVPANVLINPPVDFVREMLTLLYRTGRSFETGVADHVFGSVLRMLPATWHETPPDLVVNLIEIFNWFGKLISDNSVPLWPGMPDYEREVQARNAETRAALVRLCIDELRVKTAV